MFKSIGFQKITTLSLPQTLTIPDGTTHVWLQAETQNVRMRADSPPTHTEGLLLRQGLAPTEFPVDALDDMQFIEVTSGAILNVMYWGST